MGDMCISDENKHEDRCSLDYVLSQIDEAKEKDLRTVIIWAPTNATDFIKAMRDNRIECELRDRGYIANLIVRGGMLPYLYISW